MSDIQMPGDIGGEGYGLDLNPDFLGGLNQGLPSPHPEKAGGMRSAYDIKSLHNRLNDFEDDDLRSIPILPAGTSLKQGATYIDLRKSRPVEFVAMGGMEAGNNNWFVPKTEVPYLTWNRLIGVDNPERLGEADEGATNATPDEGAAFGPATDGVPESRSGVSPDLKSYLGEVW